MSTNTYQNLPLRAEGYWVASLADDYKLTHRSSNPAPESKPVKTGNNVDSIHAQQRGAHGQLSAPTCAYCIRRENT